MNRVVAILAVAAATLFANFPAQAQDRPNRVVYHFVDGPEQASRGLEYIRNHLEADPTADIVVVAHAAGVDFLMKGAKTARGNEYLGLIEDLELQGVKFRICGITLRERRLRRDQFLALAAFVPSGVAEITRLQQREGFAYLKP
jgi:intracellular sulfur oxidation DsrE/DsrF family protein